MMSILDKYNKNVCNKYLINLLKILLEFVKLTCLDFFKQIPFAIIKSIISFYTIH